MKTLLFTLLAMAALGHAQVDGATPRRRNVLIIITDRQSADAVCVPSRASKPSRGKKGPVS